MVARIVRGNVNDLSTLDAEGFDAICLPGGFGAVNNLAAFKKGSKQAYVNGDVSVVEGTEFSVNGDLEKALLAFKEQKKPVGLCCISPLIGAKVFEGSTITLGPDQLDLLETHVEKWGSKVVQKDVTEVHIDKENILITTPAYMCDAPIHKVKEGVDRLVRNVLHLTK